MAGQDIELRFEVENSENLRIVENIFDIYTFKNDLSDKEILLRKNKFKDLIGKTPLFYEFTQSDEFSVLEISTIESSIHVKFDTCIHSEKYFSDMFSCILGISKPNALLRFVDSSTGSVLFLGKLEDNKLEWLELTEPLKEHKIFIVGEIEYNNELLEHWGATCLDELDDSCNLLVVGLNPDSKIVEEATKKQIEVINESELFERVEGWQAEISISKEHAEWLKQNAEDNQNRNNESVKSNADLNEAYQDLDDLQKQLRNPLWRLWFSLKGLVKNS